MRRLAAAAILTMSMAAVAAAQAPMATTTGAMSAPGRAVALGPDGALWSTTKSAVGSTTTDGRTTEVALSGDADPGAITAGPDGTMWFVHHDHAIGRVTASGAVNVFDDLPAEPRSLVTGPDGNVWYTAKDTRVFHDPDAIARITPKGVLTIFGGSITGDPLDITRGPDDALWFTEPSASRIGRITTAGHVDELYVGGTPVAITAGPGGTIWFTDRQGAIDRIDSGGKLTRFPVTDDHPGDIALGPDGALWYTSDHGVGRITVGGVTSSWELGKAEPLTIAAGPDNAMYFTDAKANSLGRIAAPGAPTQTASPAPTAPPSPSPTATPGSGPSVAPVPKLNQTVVVEPARGSVRVRPPGGHFSTLDASKGIPVGSVLDTSHGAVTLQSATAKGTQTGTFHGGLFKVGQRGPAGHVDLYLRGHLTCSRKLATAAKHKPRKRRKVWGKDSGGDFSTHGRDSVTTVRGTEWLTMDTCRGTVTRVRAGAVVIRDRRNGRRHLLTAGHSYLAHHVR